MPGTMQKPDRIEKTHHTIQKLIENHHSLDHTTQGYICMIGVWDVLGRNQLDDQILIRGRSEHLQFMKEQLCAAIDKEIERRKEVE